MPKNTAPTIPAAYIDLRAKPRADVAALSASLDTFRPALEEAFGAVNGRASSFTLGASDAIAAAIDAEHLLAVKGVPRTLRGGSSYTVSSSGPGANAYHHAAIGTRFTLVRDSKGSWKLDAVARINVFPKQPRRETLTVSPAARDAIHKAAMNGIDVREG
jgi:hypothetical protein